MANVGGRGEARQRTTQINHPQIETTTYEAGNQFVYQFLLCLHKVLCIGLIEPLT